MKEVEPIREQEKQTTDTVVMVSPDSFGFNAETAENNFFQHKISSTEEEIKNRAETEFDTMATILKNLGINVLILPSRKDVVAPDAVFANNWFSCHQDGTLVIYPMRALNRRAEKQADKLINLLQNTGHPVNYVLDMSFFEKQGKALEGTGSLVLDRENKVAFAIESPRTDKDAFDYWCKNMGYEGIFFHAFDQEDKPIYHTNVIMGIGNKFVVVSLESIKNAPERRIVEKKIVETGREIIPITLNQVNAYCGNVLEINSVSREPRIIMSKTSFDAFEPSQQKTLARYGEIPSININTIETIGGGSARCMIAEVY